MAFPIILVDSTNGTASDSAASGAGPSTALTGSSAATNGSGTVVSLDGSPDLSGVVTDGSHVIYLADSTAGNRNFGRITAKDNTAKTVTVSDAFGVSLSGLSWAIGGVRATVFGASSVKLLENNANNGDMMPGWILEPQAGHTESFSSPVRTRRSGDITNGTITVRGSSTSNLPVFTYTGTGTTPMWLVGAGNYQRFENMEFRSSSASGPAFQSGSGGTYSKFVNIKVSHASNTFTKAFYSDNTPGWGLIGCEIAHCSVAGIDYSSGYVIDCKIYNNVVGIDFDAVTTSISLINSLIYNNTSVGLSLDCVNGYGLYLISGNVFYNNGAGGIDVFSTNERLYGQLVLRHNIIVNNTGGYGVEWIDVNVALLSGYGTFWDRNAYYNNASGASDIGEADTEGVGGETNRITLTADPFVDAANGDFNLNNDSGGGADLRNVTITV